MSTTYEPPKASDKQVAFIRSLLDERDLFASPKFFDAVNAMDATELADYINGLKMEAGRLNKTQASLWISALTDLPRKERADSRSRNAEPEAGMYTANGNVFRVYLGQQSGRMLVKQLVDGGGEPINMATLSEPHHPGYSYEYLGAATYRLPADAKPLPLEQAKEFGKMTGTCCVCARRLDVPESVEAGIGPVCAKRLEVS